MSSFQVHSGLRVFGGPLAFIDDVLENGYLRVVEIALDQVVHAPGAGGFFARWRVQTAIADAFGFVAEELE